MIVVMTCVVICCDSNSLLFNCFMNDILTTVWIRIKEAFCQELNCFTFVNQVQVPSNEVVFLQFDDLDPTFPQSNCETC